MAWSLTDAQSDHVIQSKDVPLKAREAFSRDFPGQIGEWERDGENFKVTLTDRHSRARHMVVYSANGEMVKRDDELKAVPAPVRNYDEGTQKKTKAQGLVSGFYYS